MLTQTTIHVRADDLRGPHDHVVDPDHASVWLGSALDIQLAFDDPATIDALAEALAAAAADMRAARK